MNQPLLTRQGDYVYYDNTRMMDARDCARKYYYRHERGWVPDTVAAPLIFGDCWHTAMDEVWKQICWAEKRDINMIGDAAFAKFMEKWEGEYSLPSASDMSVEMYEQMSPRTPDNAHGMILGYVLEHIDWIKHLELLYVELPFMVELPMLDYKKRKIIYIGKIDKVVREPIGNISLIEHKTTTAYRKAGFFKKDWIDSWTLHSQPIGYMFAAGKFLHEEISFIYIDGSLVHKAEHSGHRMFPIGWNKDAEDAWRIELMRTINYLELDHKMVANYSDPEQSVMSYYSRNINSCAGKFGMCPFFSICRDTFNPAQLTEVPEGFVEKPWYPHKFAGIEDHDVVAKVKG